MIKRPGHESYLQKVMAEERKAYSEVLEIGHQSSQTASEVEDQSESHKANLLHLLHCWPIL